MINISNVPSKDTIKSAIQNMQGLSLKQKLLGFYLPVALLLANIIVLSLMWHSILQDGLEFSASEVGWFATILILGCNLLHIIYAYVIYIHNKGTTNG